LVNADQIIDLKERVKQHQAIGCQGFVQAVMVIRQGEKEHVSQWLVAPGSNRMAGTHRRTMRGTGHGR
jgi:hypothetical protein